MSKDVLKRCLLLVVCGLLPSENSWAQSTGRDEELAREVVDSVISRFEQLYSFQVECRYDAVRQSDSVSETLFDGPRELIFAQRGREWLIRYPGSGNFRMRRDDATLQYYEAVNPESKDVSRSLHVEGPATKEALIAEHVQYAVCRMGTLWFESQCEFLRDHFRDAKLQMESDSEGRRLIVAEWIVSRDEYDRAFVVMNRELARGNIARLRLHVDPNRGHVVTRLEYVLPNGVVSTRITSNDFREVSTGLWVPFYTECTTLTGGETRASRFQLLKVDHVNEAFPEDAFDVHVPPGTRIRDSRPGMPVSIFELRDPLDVDELSFSLRHAEPDRWRRVLQAVLLWGNLLVVVLLILLWGRKRWFAKGTS